MTAPSEVITKIAKLCRQVENYYHEIQRQLTTCYRLEHQLRHAAQKDTLSKSELRQQLSDARKEYLTLGDMISDRVQEIHDISLKYSLAEFKYLYILSMARLLAALESRNPIQNFVKQFAERILPDWVIEGSEYLPDTRHQQDRLERTIMMLEARYQKRFYANKLRRSEDAENIIPLIEKLIVKDPIDINTPIWVANLLLGLIDKKHPQSASMIEAVRGYCDMALDGIDGYINLQQLNANDREKMRSDYVKTITQIQKHAQLLSMHTLRLNQVYSDCQL